MKTGQAIETTTEYFFIKNYSENEAGILFQDPFFFFKKALDELYANGLQLSFNIFRKSST